MNEVYSKLKSRKFWITIAAMLAAIGTGVSGLVVGHYDLTVVGAICMVVSSCIYAVANAYQNAAYINANAPDQIIQYAPAEELSTGQMTTTSEMTVDIGAEEEEEIEAEG